MTDIEKLCVELDKRGIPYWRMGAAGIWFGIDGHDHSFEAYQQTDRRIGLEMFDLTAEQVVGVTINSSNCSNSERTGTCRLVQTRDKPRSKAPTLTCSECGWWTADIGAAWNYCPNCGRKVVG